MSIRRPAVKPKDGTGASHDMSAIGLNKNLLTGRFSIPSIPLPWAERWRTFQRSWFARMDGGRIQHFGGQAVLVEPQDL